MTAKLFDIEDFRRVRRRPLVGAFAAVERHPKLKDIDMAAIAELSRYTTRDGFFDLDQRERQIITGLDKWPLMSSLARVKKAGLLHKVNPGGLHRIGEEPDQDSVTRAERLFSINSGLQSIWHTLRDTDTREYEASWLAPKVGQWGIGGAVAAKELTEAIVELGRLGYLSVAWVRDVPETGETVVLYRPANRRDLHNNRNTYGGAA